MKLLIGIVLVVLLGVGGCLKSLKNQQIEDNYEIGTISNLFFSNDQRILFRSDSDLFGFIDVANGSLLSVFQLEPQEEIVRFSSAAEIILSNNKTLTTFLPFREMYQNAFEAQFLSKHPEYSKIIGFTRVADMSSLILTDKYLMRIPLLREELRANLTKEEIVLKLTDEDETFFGLCEFYNIRIAKQDIFVTSKVKNGSQSLLCFRRASNLTTEPFCIQVPSDQKDPILDIVGTSDYIYIQFEKYVLAISRNLEFIQKVDQVPTQYYKGFFTIGETHQYYDPFTKTIKDMRIITEGMNGVKTIKTMKVSEIQMIIQDKNEEKFTDIVTIPKNAKENPRKVWSYTNRNNMSQFNLYVQFDDGRLVCFLIDRSTKTYEEMWEFMTIQAEKVVERQIGN